MVRQTYTVALLGVSKQCYDEVRDRLKEAMYDHVFGDDGEGEYMDMSGIGLTACIENDTQFMGMDTVPLDTPVLVKVKTERTFNVWPAEFYSGLDFLGYRHCVQCPYHVPFEDILGWMHLPK